MTQTFVFNFFVPLKMLEKFKGEMFNFSMYFGKNRNFFDTLYIEFKLFLFVFNHHIDKCPDLMKILHPTRAHTEAITVGCKPSNLFQFQWIILYYSPD